MDRFKGQTAGLAMVSGDIGAPPVSAGKLTWDFIKNGKTNLHYGEYHGHDHKYKSANKKSHLMELIILDIKSRV